MILLLLALLLGLIIFCTYQNNSIVITKSNYSNPKIPTDFDGFKIVHISDLHNKMFGHDQAKLLGKVTGLAPDIIVVTGDLIDRRKYNLASAMTFIAGAVKIAPVYYVSGNHEAWSGKFPLIRESLLGAGVCILDNAALELTKERSSIKIMGLADPGFLTANYFNAANSSKMAEQLNQWSADENFKILLSHRPEYFELYCENNVDLVFAGHAHGGQIRIPFIGGLVAPDQGLFPKYTSGSHIKGSTTMFVSRGLGNSIFPIRIFNRPEIVAVTLTPASRLLFQEGLKQGDGQGQSHGFGGLSPVGALQGGKDDGHDSAFLIKNGTAAVTRLDGSTNFYQRGVRHPGFPQVGHFAVHGHFEKVQGIADDENLFPNGGDGFLQGNNGKIMGGECDDGQVRDRAGAPAFRPEGALAGEKDID